ncbi:MAG TPA: phosphate signaling complex protein PhoU [candidate division Zixibacteria bacterium]|nr:phosphate signaling complex protein PhoU [candidate division Zixibacteria bacterium]
MSEHFLREIQELKKRLLNLSSLVEGQVRDAVRSIQERDPDLAARVRAADHEVDTTEVAVEEDCLKIMALYQPVAIDLRFIVAALKINNDLERIGDLACNIAKRAIKIAEKQPTAVPFDFTQMSNTAQSMLSRCLDALVNSDAELARQVIFMDDEIDRLNRDAFHQLKERIVERPELIDIFLNYLGVSRQLERIGDHATNIAEDVVYLVTGSIVRHPTAD